MCRRNPELGMFPQAEKKQSYNPKPYEQVTYPGQRVQIDVKVVPRWGIADPELKLFQYTAIDEFTRLRFLAAYPERPPFLPPASSKRWLNGMNAEVFSLNVHNATEHSYVKE